MIHLNAEPKSPSRGRSAVPFLPLPFMIRVHAQLQSAGSPSTCLCGMQHNLPECGARVEFTQHDFIPTGSERMRGMRMMPCTPVQ